MTIHRVIDLGRVVLCLGNNSVVHCASSSVQH